MHIQTQDERKKPSLHEDVKSLTFNDVAANESKYPQFARQCYMGAYLPITMHSKLEKDLPILVVSGEKHIDTELDIEAYISISDEDENPALAAAYTHIACIQAAADVVGKDNVLVSFELNQKTLDRWVDTIKNPMYRFKDQTSMGDALTFCVSKGFEVVASDPFHGSQEQERYDAEIEALGKHALRTEGRPRIVVHIGGSYHIGTLQGYRLKELEEQGETLLKDPEKNPFKNIYGSTIFYNTAAQSPQRDLDATLDDGVDYIANHYNAHQIDPPGRMTEADKTNIERYVLAASPTPYVDPLTHSKDEMSDEVKDEIIRNLIKKF